MVKDKKNKEKVEVITIEDNKIELSKEDKLVLEQAEQIKIERESYKYELLIDVIYDQVDERIKTEFLNTFNLKENNFKIYIAEYVKNLSNTILSDGFSDESEETQFNNKYKIFINNIKVQKNRWLKKALDSLKENSNDILDYKEKHYKDLSAKEFETIFKEELKNWRSNSSAYMIDFPLYEYFNNIKSKRSAFNYDIGSVVYNVISHSINDSPIYRQIDYIIPTFSSYNKRKKEYDLITKENQKEKDIVLQREKIINSEKNISVTEQISFMNAFDGDIKNELISLLEDDINSNTKIFLNKLIQKNQILFQPFDNYDLEIIAITLSKIDSNFYVTREIGAYEKDVLEELGKDPKQPKNRVWLRNRYKKISSSQIVMVEKPENAPQIEYDRFNVFQRVKFTIDPTNSTKMIRVFVSEKIYNDILKEDTINVYKEDFVNIKNSKYPDAVVLIFNFQLLRISAYQRGKTNMKVSTSLFINSLSIKEKNKVKINEIIENYLNQFIEKEVIIKSYSYVPKQQAWDLSFIQLTEKDLRTLVNTRKNYSLTAENSIPLLTN